jgi:uncharacterized membrane protein
MLMTDMKFRAQYTDDVFVYLDFICVVAVSAPFSIALIETVDWHRKMMWGFQLVGTNVGLYLLYSILRFPVISEINEHMEYVLPYVREHSVMDFYLAATCVAPFLSNHNFVRLFGVLTVELFFAALRFYTVALFSAWCFVPRF